METDSPHLQKTKPSARAVLFFDREMGGCRTEARRRGQEPAKRGGGPSVRWKLRCESKIKLAFSRKDQILRNGFYLTDLVPI